MCSILQMQTTPDTNKSVALFQKAFQRKNTDICSKLMIKHFNVSTALVNQESCTLF